MEREDALQDLRDYLSKMAPGPVVDVRDLLSKLKLCWGKFEGWDAEGMQAYKLDRVEDVIWTPPRLEFTLERHGSTVMGSSRAALHRWTVDLDCGKATCGASGYRQVHKRQSPLNVERIADDLAQEIIRGAKNPNLHWKTPCLVRVRIGEVIPANGLAQETVAGRRRRFRAALEARLQQHGWKVASGQNTYALGNGK